MRLVGPKTVLRNFTMDDVDDVAAIIGDDRVTKWLSFDSRDREDTRAMLEGVIGRAKQDPRTEHYLAVTLPDDNTVIGFARLGLSGVKAGKLGYAISAAHWRHGYATDAVRTILALGFDQLGLHRITAAIGPDNDASIALVKRLGFTYEGRLRNHVFTNGGWRDSELYSILTTDR